MQSLYLENKGKQHLDYHIQFPWILFNRCKLYQPCRKALPSPNTVLYFFGSPQRVMNIDGKIGRSPQQHPSVISRSMKVYNKAGRLTTSNYHLLVVLVSFNGTLQVLWPAIFQKHRSKQGLLWTRWVHVYFLRHMYYHDIIPWLNQTKGKLQLQTTP